VEDESGDVEINLYDFFGNYYSGEWANGKRHGYGVFTYADGSKYEGQWMNNWKHGDGRYTYADGTVYQGPFENDRMVGEPPREDGQFIDLNLYLLDDVVPLPNRSSLRNVFLRYISLCKKIYSFYATLGRPGGRTMTTFQCSKFLKDCRIFSKHFTSVAANRVIAQQFNKTQDNRHPLFQDPHSLFQPFLFRDFLELLVRISLLLPFSDNLLLQPSEKFDRLFQEHILKHVSEDGPRDKNSVEHYLLMTKIYSSNEEKLVQLYGVHAKRDKKALAGVEKDHTMTIRDLLLLMREKQVITRTLSVKKIVSLFEDEGGCFDVEMELSFYEFLETITTCCIALKNEEGAKSFLSQL